MKLSQLCLIGLLIIIQSCNQPQQETTQQLQMDLFVRESAKPTTYLQAINVSTVANKILTQKPDFFHHSQYGVDGYNVSGLIKSTATIATFKDVVITVSFYSQTSTLLNTQSFTVYQFVHPNDAAPFNLKVYPPDGTSNVNAAVQGAGVVPALP